MAPDSLFYDGRRRVERVPRAILDGNRLFCRVGSSLCPHSWGESTRQCRFARYRVPSRSHAIVLSTRPPLLCLRLEPASALLKPYFPGVITVISKPAFFPTAVRNGKCCFSHVLAGSMAKTSASGIVLNAFEFWRPPKPFNGNSIRTQLLPEGADAGRVDENNR